MSWLTDPGEAARHPRRTIALLLLSGLVIGGATGYVRFDRSPTWAAILGVSFAAILAYTGWKFATDPTQSERPKSRAHLRQGLVRLAMPFVAFALAFVVGLAAQSVGVFIIVFAVGLALAVVLRLTVWH